MISGFVLVVRLGLGGMFIVGSLPKIRVPYAFLSNVYSYQLVGPKTGVVVAMALPWLELFTGVCLVAGVFVGGALLVSICMAVMFTFVVGSALYRQLDISCGCFSTSIASKIGYETLMRAIVITLLSAGAYVGTILPAPRQWLAPASEPQAQDPLDPGALPAPSGA